jgi:uncharacterized protein YkwD
MRSARNVLVSLTALVVLALPGTAGAAGLTSSERSLLKEINNVRAAYGLRSLAYDGRLAVAARAHTRAMAAANDFTHGAFRTRMVQFKVRGPFLGENLAWGVGSYGTPRGIVKAWLASPGHRANLLRPGFRRIGLAELQTRFLGADGANVVTADFAGF